MDDVLDDVGRGGSRSGAGRPRGAKATAAGLRARIAAAKARESELRGELAELELRQRRGELVPVADVEQFWGERIAMTRARLLSVPTAIGADVAIADRARVVQHATTLIHQALHELADGAPPQAEAPEAKALPKPRPKAKRKAKPHYPGNGSAV